jgi:hypothetical protein
MRVGQWHRADLREQSLEERPIWLKFRRKLIQVIRRWLIEHRWKERFVQVQVIRKQGGQNSCAADGWRTAGPPDMQTILGWTLTSVVVPLALG